MNFHDWLVSVLEGKGLQGTIRYNDVEEQWELEQSIINVGLHDLFSSYAGKRIKITVEVLGDVE